MGISYQPDNPFATGYHPDNPFAPQAQAPQGHDYHAEFKSGALAKRMQGANARDAASATEMDSATDANKGMMPIAHILNTAQGIPGMEALEAKAGSLGSQLTDKPMDYRTSLQTLRGRTQHIGGLASGAEHIVGGAAMLPFLPAGGAASGAIIGGADQLLAADPDRSAGDRALRTVAGTAAGAALGKVGEVAGPFLRSLKAKTNAANIIAREGERSLSTGPLYDAARRVNPALTNTPAIQQQVAEPDVANIIKGLQETRQFRGLPATHPEVLDATAHTLTDLRRQAERGLDRPIPTKPNIGRYEQQDYGDAKGALVDAMSGTPGQPGPMPSYRAADKLYAQHSGEIDAVGEGSEALKNATSSAIPSKPNIVPKSRESFSLDMGKATQGERSAASEGVLGALKESPKFKHLPFLRIPYAPSDAMQAAPDLLRRTQDPTQAANDILVKLGLIGGSSAAQ